MQLNEIAEVLQAKLQGASVGFQKVSTDTRTIEKDNLFFALTGPNFDGHDYIVAATEKNAAAAVVSKDVDCNLPLLKVGDTVEALGKLAAYYRSKFDLPIIAVTGSCGKTSTKAMIANILNLRAKTMCTQGTMNNHIGVPLTLMKLQPEHQFSVIEMGANAPGEIAYLSDMTKPKVTCVTNVAPAHLEGFGSIKGVAAAKSEIYQALPVDGVAVINADDNYSDYMLTQNNSKKHLLFGVQNKADIQGRNVQLNKQGCPEFTLVMPDGSAEISLPLVGEHNVMNALAAAACAYAVGFSIDDIKKGLESLQPIDMRLVRYNGLNGSCVIDDSYNANPLSFDAALHVLSMTEGKKLLVVGDMGELGKDTVRFHSEVGAKAKNLGVNKLYAIGDLSQHTAQSFGKNACCFNSHEALIAELVADLAEDVTVLIKGSRKAEMEKVVRAISAESK